VHFAQSAGPGGSRPTSATFTMVLNFTTTNTMYKIIASQECCSRCSVLLLYANSMALTCQINWKLFAFIWAFIWATHIFLQAHGDQNSQQFLASEWIFIRLAIAIENVSVCRLLTVCTVRKR